MSNTALRSIKVAAMLLRRPKDLAPYLTHNVVGRRSPLDLGLPWMSYAVIDALSERLTASSVVHEYGAGGSTVFFAQRAGTVVSLESASEWHAVTAMRLQLLGAQNVDLRFAEADFTDAQRLRQSAFYQALPTGPADVILIDSEDHHQGHACRPQLFAFAEDQVREGGVIVVDDADRYQLLRTRNRARGRRTFKGVGPGRAFVSMTDMYLY